MSRFARSAPQDPRMMMAGRRSGGMRWWVLVLAAGYLGYYYFSNRQEASFTGRQQLVETSVEQDVALGLQAYQQILSEERGKVIREGEVPDMVRGIAQRLINAGPDVEALIRQGNNVQTETPWDEFEWAVSVIESDQANAFCLPGGMMAVYTGILPVTQNDDALAAVMGHEIAHAILRHGAERMAHQKLTQIGTAAAGMASSDMDPQRQQMVMAAIGAGTKFGVLLPFSRDHESEADYVGLMLAAGACYDPEQAIGLWERMGAQGGGQRPPEFMSTHPSSETRISKLREWMPEAKKIRAAMCKSQ
ncbi:MAG: M48 family metallopeptidase [Ahniella sp.]|nr:M48 family metallopeptidase [Ahniella sp.]